jgi:hypothetical protein
MISFVTSARLKMRGCCEMWDRIRSQAESRWRLITKAQPGQSTPPRSFAIPAEVSDRAEALLRNEERDGVKYVRDSDGFPVRVVWRYEDAAEALGEGDGSERE